MLFRSTSLEPCPKRLHLRLVEFRCEEAEWAPVLRCSLELSDEAESGRRVMDIGNPRQRFGWLTGSGSDQLRVRSLIAPSAGGRVRVRLWIWAKRQ